MVTKPSSAEPAAYSLIRTRAIATLSIWS